MPWLLMSWSACRQTPPPAPDLVARIGPEEIRYGRFEDYVKRTAGDGETVLAGDVLSQLFDQFLDEELLARLASDRGLARDGASAAARRRAIDALLAAELKKDPSPQEIAAYYQAHRGEFARPERVRLRQILTQDRATAERALRELAGGADFAQLARQLSQDPGAASGGFQGELSRQDLPPAFAEVIFSLEPGEVSRLVPAEYGFHIFQVVARSPAEVVPLEEARDEIAERLRQERADRALTGLVGEARRRYNVDVYGRNLPFEYRGSYKGHA
ncbi:MAG TPA: peptidylprolyl isomerase [Thermoanaerobaculia bacterium]|nr:peptidylprolyl isomerase [Thermoanaerobaculia bacterium]